jgi:hypothetical protein
VSPTPRPRHLYLFFDEAGDLNFKESGTRHYLCGVLAIRNPWPLMDRLNTLRQELFQNTLIPESFHAAEDRQLVRDRVFETLVEEGRFDYFAGIADKTEAPTEYRDDATFYSLMADFTLRMVLNNYPTADPIYLITDRLPMKRKREAVLKGFKASLETLVKQREYPGEYEIAHQSAAAQGCLQAADYLNWALFRRWERSDDRSYDQIAHFVRFETRINWGLLKR